MLSLVEKITFDEMIEVMNKEMLDALQAKYPRVFWANYCIVDNTCVVFYDSKKKDERIKVKIRSFLKRRYIPWLETELIFGKKELFTLGEYKT